MKKILLCTFVLLIFLSLRNGAFAIYDPLSQKNNIFGIHILFPEELREAANLVNSQGGDWGYVTIPIKASDKNLDKWQKFMDDCKKDHLIPLVRLATDGDYFSQSSWSKPADGDIVDFANFLDSLSWPTKNRYVIVYNEPNRGDEWGGAPNAAEYAEILDYAVTAFKQRSADFFIISAGFDNASVNNPRIQSVNEFTFMYLMHDAIPGIFSEIDGLGSHSYPNPGFSAPPSATQEGIYSFRYQSNIAYSLSGKTLPVFITETGWSSDSVSYDLQANYYGQTFASYWNDTHVVAVTPFVLNAGEGPFAKLSFLKNGSQTKLYSTYQGFPKIKGEPLLTNDFGSLMQVQNRLIPVKKFKGDETINSIFEKINKSTRTFFKWFLGA